MMVEVQGLRRFSRFGPVSGVLVSRVLPSTANSTDSYG